ncbi:copper-binding protein [Solihabitans fulvus]|uniref:Copper-binding protein n=1 Tax=Solihabitans fulvus TaxID=1892852 RepID=A0A5B2WLH2_9PSEU|nr:cupredoxin family copper-binding protein [Solihabitans fulvus]KAA2252255.1 copper-binding protein [Solihabitans fulvus]
MTRRRSRVARWVNAFAAAWLVALVAPGSAHAETHQIAIVGHAFSPVSMTVHVGDTITWTNSDQAPHDATTTSAPASFRSPTLTTGQSWSYQVTTPGDYAYFCSIHPDMRAQLTVLPADPPPAQQQPAPAQPAPAQPAPAQPIPTQPAKQPDPGTQPGQHQPTEAEQPAVPVQQPAASAAAPTAPSSTSAGTAVAAAASADPKVNPMLLVAALVAGVTVLCLLLLGSRPNQT